MAKKKPSRSASSERVPYVQAAAFCDQVIEGKDGVISAIRLVDRVYVTESSRVPRSDDEEPLYLVRFPTLLVCLKSGPVKGKRTVQLQHAPPAPPALPSAPLEAEFRGDNKGVNIILKFGVLPMAPGIHWFAVTFGGRELTRIALEVSIQQAR